MMKSDITDSGLFGCMALYLASNGNFFCFLVFGILCFLCYLEKP